MNRKQRFILVIYRLSFRIDVGLHQGSALSPHLFIIIMDVLASELGSKPPESMLFADDLVLCETSRQKVEQELERWRDQFERHGLRISRTKTEYMPTPYKEENIKLGDGPTQTVKVFKIWGVCLQQKEAQRLM